MLNALNHQMTTYKVRNINQTLGFFSITIGWIVTNIIYSIYLSLTYGEATDSSVILFWSGLFVYIAWGIFIIYPLKRLNHSKALFQRRIFPFITTVYAGLIYVILVGGTFRDFGLVKMFLLLPLLIGLLFGLTYSTLIHSGKIVNLLNARPWLKVLSFISPVIILTFFLLLLPTLIPNVVYRFMPSQIRDKIFIKTIAHFKVGESFKKLDRAVPGHFDDWIQNGNGGGSSSGPLIDYEIHVKDDTIRTLVITVH